MKRFRRIGSAIFTVISIAMLVACGGSEGDEPVKEDSSEILRIGGGGYVNYNNCVVDFDECPTIGKFCESVTYTWCEPVCWYDSTCPSSMMCFDDVDYFCQIPREAIERATGGTCSVPSCRPRDRLR
jgi:hypothetical protein